ncbi:MAG: HRDC domain-containing protein, partial [Myxococcales bacterium]|nr:HRDC domain-containing protein [Myxococcales bacterium]
AATGLDRTPTFGALSERSEDWLMALLRRCVAAGWVDFSGGDRPVVMLTEDGAAVMKAERPARLLLPPTHRPGAGGGAASGSGRKRGPAPEMDELDAEARALFDALREYRLGVARSEGVPPYVVASDRTLRDVARIRPRSLGDLELAHGIGPSKVKRYGDGLLAVVTDYLGA